MDSIIKNQTKLTMTSFIDDNFIKNLETSLRFGCPLLIQDVEKIDQILYPILNKEIHKQGGRVLIRVGDQEVDFHQAFNLFMITRDSNARYLIYLDLLQMYVLEYHL